MARSMAIAALAGLAGAPVVRAQAPSLPVPDLVLPTGVEVIRIEVMVSGKHGRPRAGLQKEDFVVLEDGRPQPIVQFHAFARPAAAPPPVAPATGQPPAPVAEEEGEDLLPSRYVVLAIDDVHMGFESLVRVRKALRRFLMEDLRPEDQVALVTTSGASALSQEFTSDRAVLQQVLSRLSPKGRPLGWSDIPYISEYQAELIENGDVFAFDAAVQELLHAGLYQDEASAEPLVRRKARGILTDAVYNARLTLEALESLCRGLAGLTGRKALFLVSDGFVTGLSARSGAEFDLRRIADAGTRAGVVIYALDAGGLRSGMPLATPPASPRRPSFQSLGVIEAMRARGENAARDALHTLAADTGGFLAENTNNLQAGLRDLLTDTETYYVLAYEPTNRKRDGRFRRIEVRLPGVRGVEVRTRSGYFAPNDSRLAVVDRTPEEEARWEEQRRTELHTALRALAPLAAIPVRVSADFVSFEPGVSQVVVSGSMDVTALPFVRQHGRRQATLDSVAVVYGESGEVAATLPTEQTAMDLTDADYELLAREGLPYQRAVALGPGRYQVRLATREDATGLLGSAWQRVDVPELARGGLALSSLFLLKDEQGAAAAASPAADPDLRSAQALRRFGRDERLYVQLYAYNPGRDASGATDLVAQAQVLHESRVLATAAPEPMAREQPQGPVPHLSRIKLQRFEPGDYELRVTVTDRNARAIEMRTVGFTID